MPRRSLLLLSCLVILLSPPGCGDAEAPCEGADCGEAQTSQDNGSGDDTDTDGDGLTDLLEGMLGTNPADPDTDGDGLPDGDEVGDDRSTPVDSDSDGLIDAVESNVVDQDDDCLPDQADSDNVRAAMPTLEDLDRACCCGGTCSELGFTILDGTSCSDTGELTCVTDEPDTDGDGINDSCDFDPMTP